MISKQNLLATLWTLFFIFYLNVTYSQNVCESIKEYKALKKILIDTQNKNENITDKINSFNIENKNLSEAEKNIIISLLKSYSYGRLISIQDEELATFYLDKTKKLIGKNINRNHCLNIPVLELELLNYPFEERPNICKKIIDICEFNKMNPCEHYKMMGYIYHILGRGDMGVRGLENAKKWYEKAITFADEDMEIITKSKNNLGSVYQDLGNYKKALGIHEETLWLRLDYYKRENKDVAVSYFNIGDVLRQLGRFDKAIQNYKKFIDAYRFQNIHKIGAFIQIAEIEKNRNNIDSASIYYSKAIETLDKIRLLSGTEDATQGYIDLSRDNYGDILDFAFEHDLELAFKIFEKSRDVRLQEQLKDIHAKDFSGLPEDKIQQERELKSIILENENSLNSRKILSSETVDSLREEIEQSKGELNKLIKELESKYPQYYRLKYDLETITIDEIQKGFLDDNTSLVEYVVMTDDNNIIQDILIIRIDKNHTEKYRVPKDSLLGINKRIGIVLDLIQNGNAMHTKDSVKEFNFHSNLLYNILLKNMAKEKPLKKYIHILPQGELSQIPFEALITENKEKGNWKNDNFLIKTHVVNYGYSSTILEHNLKMKYCPKSNFLGVAPVNFDQSINLGALKGSELNVEDYNKILGTKQSSITLFEENANKAEFKDAIKKNGFDIIHFASHAIAANTKNPKVFFRSDSLSLAELFTLNMKTNMVVISACESSGGNYRAGEGVLSLARGFMYAGSPSTISSLWKVRDEIASKTMKEFYRNIASGRKKDESLRNAKLELIEKGRPIYEWAAFIHVGNNESVDFCGRTRSCWLYLILILMLGVILLQVKKYYSKEKF